MEMTDAQTISDLAKKMREILENKQRFPFLDRRPHYLSVELLIPVEKKCNSTDPNLIVPIVTEWFRDFVCSQPKMAVQIFLAEGVIEVEELARDVKDECFCLSLILEAFLRYGPQVADSKGYPAQGPIGTIH